ncbi:hypothetical protein [Streptomyces sp. NPDC127038]|uniref:hypothetical protein n=1 Tax=Streptomyces sp. NPDC127038 TaxID=3347114 RepID=UPI00365C4674
MIEANRPARTSGGKTAAEECRTTRRLPSGHAVEPVAPDEATAAKARAAIRGTRRDEYDRLAEVPAHLSLLRDALARGEDRQARTCPATGTGRGPTHPRHRRPFRAALTTQITLSQWVSKTSSCVS